MSLKIDVTQKTPGHHEIALDGRLDTQTHDQFDELLKKLPVREARSIRLDLAKLSYMSSMGLRVVIQLIKELRAQKAVFQMVNLQPQIQKVLDIAAALPAQAVFKDVAEADAYLDLMQKRAVRGEQQGG